MSPSFIQGADGELIEVPELEVTQEHTLTGTRQTGVHVRRGGELFVRGTIQGTLSVDAGGVVVVHGTIQGTLHVAGGGSAVIAGAQQGTVHIEDGGTVSIEATGKLHGTISNYGTLINHGERGGTVSGEGFFDDKPGSRVIPPNADGMYVWAD